MTSHFGLLLLFAAFVSTVFALLQRETPRDQALLALKMLGGFVGAALLLGWITYPLPL